MEYSQFESHGPLSPSLSPQSSRRMRNLEVVLLPLGWDAFIWQDYLQHITEDFI